MRQLISCIVLALLASCAALPTSNGSDMLAVCRAQEAAWNRGDLEGFMARGYWRSPQLTFFSGGSDTRGFDAMLAHYRERYQQGGREMGVLSFSDLEPVVLAQDAGLVRGRWKVTFKDGSVSEGLFTLAMRRLSEGWRIVHDHTSVGG
jgi:beta-aspartyl-peptidase (threonine type)